MSEELKSSYAPFLTLNSELLTASAVVLAGGKSSRMGQPKALLLFDGEPLIVHTVRFLQKQFSDLVVVAAPEQQLPSLPVTLVRDDVAYQGPVGGILYGLRAAQQEICFVTSCDAPFLDLALVAYLVSLIADYDVVVPHWQERLQPLHAVYRKSVAPLLEEQLARNELRPIFLYKKVRTREVSEEEIRRIDPQGLSFRNMNSPEDYQTALAQWQEFRQRTQAEMRDRESRQGVETEIELETEPENKSGGAVSVSSSTPPASPVSSSIPQASSSSISVSHLYLKVELFGVARLKAKTATVALTLPAEANLGDALHALAQVVPTLVGPVLTPDCRSLVPGYACNVNGIDFTRDSTRPIRAGDSLLVLSSDAGG